MRSYHPLPQKTCGFLPRESTLFRVGFENTVFSFKTEWASRTTIRGVCKRSYELWIPFILRSVFRITQLHVMLLAFQADQTILGGRLQNKPNEVLLNKYATCLLAAIKTRQ